MLCSDITGADFIEVMNSNWVQFYERALIDSAVAGIAWSGGENLGFNGG